MILEYVIGLSVITRALMREAGRKIQSKEDMWYENQRMHRCPYVEERNVWPVEAGTILS